MMVGPTEQAGESGSLVLHTPKGYIGVHNSTQMKTNLTKQVPGKGLNSLAPCNYL